MSEEREKNPKLELKKVVKMGKPVEIVLKTKKQIAEGEGKYGPWYLWKAEVKGLKVSNAETNAEIENYTGDVVFFSPTERFQEQLIKATNEEEVGVKIEVNKEAFEMDDGKIVGKWVVKKLDGGKISPSSLKPSEQKLVDDVNELLGEGYEITIEEFIQEAKQRETEDIKFSDERLKELYEILR